MKESNVFDKVLDALIEEAAKMASDELGNELPEPEKVEFSKEHEKKMKKLFQKERNKLIMKKMYRFSQRVALILFVCTLISGIAVVSVQAWRVRFLNFVIEMTQTHTDINFGDSETKGDSYSTDEINLEYIPEDFRLDKSNINPNSIFLNFRKEEKYFNITVKNVDGLISIDTENADTRKLKIKDNEAFYSTNHNANFLIWHDEEYAYKLSGNIDEKEMLKIAENIKK